MAEPSDPSDNGYYETSDFPVVEIAGYGYAIDWQTHEKTKMVERLSRGIKIADEDAGLFASIFESLRELHGYPYARLDWIAKSNGCRSLECIMPDAGQGVWMYIYSAIGDHEGTPMEQNLTPYERLDTHNLDYADTGIFLVESLATYLKYAGIFFPYIKTHLEGTHKETKFGSVRESYDITYSFELPHEPAFDYVTKLGFYAKNIRLQLDEISEGIIAIHGKNLATLETKSNGSKVWVASHIPSPAAAVQLFSMLSKPLKWKHII